MGDGADDATEQAMREADRNPDLWNTLLRPESEGALGETEHRIAVARSVGLMLDHLCTNGSWTDDERDEIIALARSSPAPYGEHLRCEDHPSLPMGHDDAHCGGAGIVAPATPAAEPMEPLRQTLKWLDEATRPGNEPDPKEVRAAVLKACGELTAIRHGASAPVGEREGTLAKIEAAQAEVSRICKERWGGGHGWRTSIPARPDYDTDLIIGAALRSAAAALRAELRDSNATLPSNDFGVLEALLEDTADLLRVEASPPSHSEPPLAWVLEFRNQCSRFMNSEQD